jgi:hypothetical protein
MGVSEQTFYLWKRHYGSPCHSEMHGRDFFPWYNEEHHHVALGLMTLIAP